MNIQFVNLVHLVHTGVLDIVGASNLILLANSSRHLLRLQQPRAANSICLGQHLLRFSERGGADQLHLCPDILVQAACVRCHGSKCPLLTAFWSERRCADGV